MIKIKYKKMLKEKKAEIETKLKQIESIEKTKPKGKEYSFFEYDQNNSGGSFVINAQVANKVFIEATSLQEANKKAFEIGIYFDGVSIGSDCGCCGDRWHEPYEDLKFPYRYGTLNLEDVKKSGYDYKPTNWIAYGQKEAEKDKYDLIFKNVKEYAKYLMQDRWFGNKVIIIYYKDGKRDRLE